MADNHQEAGSYQMPPATLTSKPLKQQQQAFKDTTNQTDSSPSGGYYFNVAQKGKLILPTALWILLVLAGVSFLTLLASLNRTVDTLDTLVEIEQEREAKHRWDHLHSEQTRLGRHQADKLTEVPPKHHPEQAEHISSWLSLPSFGGLDPIEAASGKGADLEEPEVSGSFIISSSSSALGEDQPPADVIDSMMKQVMQTLLPGSESARWRPSAESRRKSSAHSSQQSASGPIISANIEHLTVNLNGDAEDSNEAQSDAARSQRRPGGHNADPLASIMAQLMDSKPLGMAAAPIVIDLDEDVKPSRHEHKQMSVSPLANMLMPPSPFVSLLELPARQNNPPRPFDDLIFIESKPPRFESAFPLDEAAQRDRGKQRHGNRHSSPYELPVGEPISSLLDSMRDFDETSANQGTIGPAQSSSSKASEQGKWDVLANDLADSLLGPAFQPMPSEPVNKPESIVLVNGVPLDRAEHFPTNFLGQVFPEAGQRKPTSVQAQDGNIGDLFSMIFGPSSRAPATGGDSSSTKSETTPTPAESASSEPINLDQMVKTIQKELGEPFAQLDATPAGGNAASSPQPTKDAINELLVSSIAPKPDGATDSKLSTSSSKEEQTGDSALSDLFGTMFTMAQFGNDHQQQQQQQQQRPSSQSGGSSSSGTNSAKETMMCNCTRVSSGNSSGGFRQQSSETSVSSSRPNNGNSGGNNMSNSNNSNNRGGASSGSGNSGNSNNDGRNWPSASSSSGGNNGGNSGGNSGQSGGQSNSGGQNGNSNGGSSTWQDGAARPIGYATYSGRPENAPSAYAVASLMADPGDDSPVSRQLQGTQQAPELTIRPNSLLSALNNSTNHLLPRIIKRLNETNLPSLPTLTTSPNDSPRSM